MGAKVEGAIPPIIADAASLGLTTSGGPYLLSMMLSFWFRVLLPYRVAITQIYGQEMVRQKGPQEPMATMAAPGG